MSKAWERQPSNNRRTKLLRKTEIDGKVLLERPNDRRRLKRRRRRRDHLTKHSNQIKAYQYCCVFCSSIKITTEGMVKYTSCVSG